jgi:predicted MFS family arabinose efflux permease
VFLIALLLTVASLFLIATGFTGTGLIATFTFQTFSSALSPGGVAGTLGNRLKAIAANTTWRDLGSGAGALIGGILLGSSYLRVLIFYVALLLLAFVINHVLRKKRIQALIQWR